MIAPDRAAKDDICKSSYFVKEGEALLLVQKVGKKCHKAKEPVVSGSTH